MEKKYNKIDFSPGSSIESAFTELLQFAEKEGLACGDFNGQTIYSDTDTLDSAYKKITGKYKDEYDAEQKADHDRYLREEREHKDSIPELTIEWIEKGKKVLDQEYWDKWKECVPIRLGDLYRGMELGCTLEIVKPLNEGRTFGHVKKIIYNQGHSGMSFSLVCSMVGAFCNRGDEFVKYVR